MKRILIVVFCLFIHFGSWAISDTTIVSQLNTINEKSDLVSGNQILKARIDLLENHETWTLAMLGIGLAITALLLVLIQWYLSKKAEDYVFSNLAKIVNKDKKAFKKAIEIKAIEIELMSKYPIYIISDEQVKNCNSSRLLSMLKEFHFEIVERISYKVALETSFSDKCVIVFCDEPVNEKRDIDMVKKFLKVIPKLGVFGYAIHYKDDFKNLFKEKGCVSFAQFPSQVYNNLMSLLHYKRYLNK